MVERARELIRPYVEKEGVIGVYLLGSVTRTYRDDLSDYDIEVIVEDAVYEATPDEERQVFFFKEGTPEGERPIVDYEFYLIPWSDFVGLTESTHDLFHQPYQHAVILHDPQGRIAPIIERLANLPEGVRRDRLTVHFLEFLYRLGRARKTVHRADGSGPAVKIIESGRFPVELMVTHEFPLEEIDEAFDVVVNRRDEPIKVVLAPWA